MTQYTPPPPSGPWSAAAPRRGNGPAIASLVCGLLGCVPFLTGLAAVILGIIGLRKTRDPRVSGRGMAIAGLVLGALSFGGWAVMGLSVGLGLSAAFTSAEPVRKVAEQFTKDLSAGAIDAALALSEPGTERATLAAAAEEMKPWGTLLNLGLNSVSLKIKNDDARYDLGGAATFSRAAKRYTITLHRVDETYKVVKFQFE